MRAGTSVVLSGTLLLCVLGYGVRRLAFAQSGSTNRDIHLRFTDKDGQIDYNWMAPAGSTGSLGTLAIHANLGNRAASLSLMPQVHGPSSGLHLEAWEQAGNGGGATAVFSNAGSKVRVTLALHLSGRNLVCDLSADQPTLSSFIVGPLTSTGAIKTIEVPYYTGKLALLPDAGVFANAYFDWKASRATKLELTEATYNAETNGARNPLHERYVVSVSNTLDDVLPVIDNPASPFLSKVAGATVIDIWNQQHFNEITEALGKLSEYGKQNCVVLIHNWQRSGYDNALPSHFPANAAQGGDPELKKAIQSVRALGCLAALHQNYVDYYPNADNFTKQAVALSSDGSATKAWFNSGTHIQSFATKPSWFIRNAQQQATDIHDLYQTNASFIDVNSAAVPWFRADMEAGQPGAGTFAATVSANRDLWSLERKANAGPVFGEGANHWFWSGLLDGVEAQPGAGFTPQGENTPLFVDFDLLRIHPLQANHGMGMYDRWVKPHTEATDTKLADAYRMQEIVYGHAPYIGGDSWHSVSRILMEEELASAVATRYGTQKVRKIQYQVGGKWVDSSSAAKAADWSRVAVEYENGDRIVANARPESLRWENRDLPQYGWGAKGQDLLAYTAMRDGSLRDYAQTADLYFANARNQDDVEGSADAAAPEVKNFTQTGQRNGLMQLGWTVLEGTRGNDLNTFVHFVDATGKIRFQADYKERQPTGSWKPGDRILSDPFEVKIPANAQDGSYQVRVGLYAPGSGNRFHLRGQADGEGRYTLGTLTLADGGRRAAFEPVRSTSGRDARLNQGGRVIDFQTLQTDGMVMMHREQGRWMLRTYPNYREVVVRLSAASFPLPATVTCTGGTTPQSPVVENGYWQLHTKGSRSCEWR